MGTSVFIDLDTSGETFTGQLVGPAASNVAAPPFSFLGDLTSGFGSSAVGTLDLVTAGTSRFNINSTAGTFAVPVTINKLALATTSTRGLLVQNTTAATSGVTVQISPRTEWLGTAWDTAASETVAFFAEVLPATAGTPTGIWRLGSLINGSLGAFYPIIAHSDGSVDFGTSIQVRDGANVNYGSTFSHSWAPANGKLNLTTNNEVAGVGLDFITDAVMKIRTRAQTGYATVDALGYNASGVAGISTTVTSAGLVGKTITFVNGIITGFA